MLRITHFNIGQGNAYCRRFRILAMALRTLGAALFLCTCSAMRTTLGAALLLCTCSAMRSPSSLPEVGGLLRRVENLDDVDRRARRAATDS